MRLFAAVAMSMVCVLTLNVSAADKGGVKKGQTVCLPETETTSLRHSALKGPDKPDEIIRTDVNHDGKPEIIERWWNGHRVRWFDENGDMRADDINGDQVDDSLQIDRDGDGFYDGPSDMTVDWVDDDGDGDADLQVIAINPSTTQTTIHAGESHYMIFVDVDDDNVHGFVDWQTFAFPCWRALNTTNYPNPNLQTCFSPDYNGDSVFLKTHQPPFSLEDPRYNWENPFAFYDFDKDGCSEMAIRFCDSPVRIPDKPEIAGTRFDAKNEEAYVTYDLDNDTQRGNEMDFDMTLRFEGGEKMDYSKYAEKHPKLKAPKWMLPYWRYNNWRQIDELCYVPHDKCYEELFKPKWKECWLCFDEDDDDHRWERVELYYPDPGELTSTARWGKDRKTGGLPGHPQSDTLGDRGEYDRDNSGHGKLYVGRWDNKIHLYGAEWGAWIPDYGAKYWGSSPVIGDSSPEKAPKVEELVTYKDTNKNGFIDEITYDYDADSTPDLVISLLKYGSDKDVAETFDPAKLKWQGLHEAFGKLVARSWDDALIIYRAAWTKGLNDAQMDDLSIAASTAEKYHKAYWLKEKLFRKLDRQLAQGGAEQKAAREQLQKVYFTGDTHGFANFIKSRAW